MAPRAPLGSTRCYLVILQVLKSTAKDHVIYHCSSRPPIQDDEIEKGVVSLGELNFLFTFILFYVLLFFMSREEERDTPWTEGMCDDDDHHTLGVNNG